LIVITFAGINFINLQEDPFDLEFKRYVRRHEQALKDYNELKEYNGLKAYKGLKYYNESPKIILVKVQDVGHGNRLQSIVCGFIYALVSTEHIFMLDYKYSGYHDFPFNVNFDDANIIRNQSTTILNHYGMNDWYVTLHSNFELNAILTIETFDYPCAALYANKNYKEKLQRMFPDGNMFHKVAKRLFKWKPRIENLVDKHLKMLRSYDFILGVQIRTLKGQGNLNLPTIDDYCSISNSVLAGRSNPVVFLAGDTNEARLKFINCSSVPVRFIHQDLSLNEYNNPGNDLNGLIDLLILSRTNLNLVTFSSSFGAVASGKFFYSNLYVLAISGVPPVYLMACNDNSIVKYWKATCSEPCMYKAKQIKDHDDLKVFKTHPHYLHFLQCHY
jgi:hypothetical protein